MDVGRVSFTAKSVLHLNAFGSIRPADAGSLKCKIEASFTL